MTVTVEINERDLETAINSRILPAVPGIQAAMAGAFYEQVLANFGEFGVDRPERWAPLTPGYARKVGRPFATLYVTGALFNAVKLDTADASVSVSNDDVPYAMVHQFGGGNNIPARPYFPLDEEGNVTPRTRRVVIAAAKAALKREL